nr:alcohol dehydrogenase catalytic domain-containing protein [uncultured Gellertiella sp.]
MRAAVLAVHGQPLVVGPVEKPQAGPGEILVRLAACGICHSDVHIWKGDFRAEADPVPHVLGHEGVGQVEAVGPGVTTWQVGDPAGVPWLHDTCLHCEECLDGQESFCQHQRAHGWNVPGAFADYVVADARFAVRLPAGLDPVQTAPVMCAGVTAYGALRRAHLREGETVAIFGCGGLGLYAVQLAVRMGAKVLAIDSDPEKLVHARRYGAASVEIADTGLAERLGALAVKPHVVINFAPTTRTWAPLLAAIRPRGRIVAAAIVAEPVPLSQEWLTGSGVTITGTSVGTRAEMEDVVRIHTVRPLENPVIEIGLEEATAALSALDGGTARGRYVIRF